MITRLLMAQGLRVGTYTSPHLERVNERIARNGEPIGDEDFAEQIAAIADLEVLAGVRPSYFEILTAAAFRWFADVAVDVAVRRGRAARSVGRHERGRRPGGRGHERRAGPHRVRRTDARPTSPRRRPGIVKPGSHPRCSARPTPSSPPSSGPRSAAAVPGARRRLRRAREPAGARRARCSTCARPTATYPEVFLPLHGAPPGRQRRRRPDRGRELLRRRRSTSEVVRRGASPT